MSVSFTYGLLSVTLPNPKLGDSENINHQVTFKQTMSVATDGSICTYKKTPAITTLNLTFELNPVEWNAYVSFLDAAVGQVVTYVDHLGVSRTGVILTTVLEAANTGRYCNTADGFRTHTLQFVVS